MKSSKIVGCIMILIGTQIGAGMLALATESAAAGFPWASLLMISLWAITTITGLMVVEVNLALPSKACSFSSMAEKTLGKVGKVIIWIAYLLLLYSITTAYVSGGASIITSTLRSLLHIDVPIWVNAVIFTIVLGLPVFWSTQVVDYVNRSLFSVKGILLLATIVLILAHVEIKRILFVPTLGQTKYLFTAAPIFVMAFFYHCVLPSIRMYIGDDPKQLKRIIILGTICSLVVYLLWLAASLGAVPLHGENSFYSWAKNSGMVGDFIQLVVNTLQSKWVTSSINGFSNVAMTTSFLGVSLGLFDFLAEGCKRSDTRLGRGQTILLTLIPPLVFTIFFPNGFTMALNYAAAFIAFIAIALPPLMVYRLRKNPHLSSRYRMFAGNGLLLVIGLIGLVLMILPVLVNLKLLPNLINLVN